MEQVKKNTRQAVVIGRSGNKSIKIAIEYTLMHPKYGKYMRRRTVLGVHDEGNKASVGDVVEITQCRPYSKSKRWRLVNVVKKAVAR